VPPSAVPNIYFETECEKEFLWEKNTAILFMESSYKFGAILVYKVGFL
jgi:hypothetical protein